MSSTVAGPAVKRSGYKVENKTLSLIRSYQNSVLPVSVLSSKSGSAGMIIIGVGTSASGGAIAPPF